MFRDTSSTSSSGTQDLRLDRRRGVAVPDRPLHHRRRIGARGRDDRGRGWTSTLGQHRRRRWPRRRGEGRSISMWATVLRTIATWTVSTGLVSIGRESAIIETGGAVGAISGRAARRPGRRDTVGIAAAFAAHTTPPSPRFYLEEHLQVWRSRRAVKFAALGALGGHLASLWLLHGHPVFPPVQGSYVHVLLEMGMIACCPPSSCRALPPAPRPGERRRLARRPGGAPGSPSWRSSRRGRRSGRLVPARRLQRHGGAAARRSPRRSRSPSHSPSGS
ncbi:MAG: chloride channel protein [Acidimicrobiales bacterium]